MTGADQRLQRLLHPHDRRAPRAPRAGVPAADLRRAARSTKASTPGSTAAAASPSTPRRSSSTASVRSTGSRRSGSRRRTTSSVSPPTRTGCSPSTTRTRSSSCPSSGPTRRGASSSRASTTSASAGRRSAGACPVPWDPDQVVYVWVDALINYWSALAFAREGEDLRERALAGGPPPPGEGHPQVPLRDLAGAPDGRGDRACPSSSSCTAIC